MVRTDTPSNRSATDPMRYTVGNWTVSGKKKVQFLNYRNYLPAVLLTSQLFNYFKPTFF